MVTQPRRPFLDYYRANEISPVAQDIADLGAHFERRGSLYRSLGIVPSLLEGRRVIEFGPGSGHNAVYTLSLHPARYVLVDANPAGLRNTRELLTRHAPEPGRFEVVESLFEAFESDERFDLVLCEGAIPLQLDPAFTAQRLGRFAAPGSVFVLTTEDAATNLSDLLRRLIARSVAPEELPIEERLARLRPIFADHLSTLGATTRPVDDWVLDKITQPFLGEMFSVDQAIDALAGSGLEIYHASPHFFSVWQWYKTQIGERRDYGDAVRNAYFTNLLNLVDIRHEAKVVHDTAFGRNLLESATAFFHELRTAELETQDFKPAVARLHDIAVSLQALAPITAASIDEGLELWSASARNSALPPTPNLRSFWGHGQQYLSFIRA